MAKPRPFPALTGGCKCRRVRFRLELPPLFCYACHCSECQRDSGTAFAAAAVIEGDRITSTGPIFPRRFTTSRLTGETNHSYGCPTCGNVVWRCGNWSHGLINVPIGTMDWSGLLEPDIHMFIEDKVKWLPLPEGAKTCKGPYDRNKEWPRSSLDRMEAFKKRYAAAQQSLHSYPDGENSEADKTPTADSPEELDDEEAEERYNEIEKALQERLEQLSLKLSEQDKA